MTGYGQSTYEESDLRMKVEARSYNHRFCEIVIRMPRQLLQFEDQVKKVIQSHIQRGKVDVYISIEGTGLVKKNVQVHWDLLNEYMNAAKIIEQNLNIPSQLKVEDILFQEQLVAIDEQVEPNDLFATLLLETTEKAMGELLQMRKIEGEKLYQDLKKRIETIQIQVKQLKDLAPNVVKYYRDRLLKRMEEYLQTFEIDENRILTEVAIFAEKSNIDEELTRLDSHLEQFLLTMDEEKAIGRKLDFLVQEMNREVNTIGSKANDIQISKLVVDLKSEIEKIKEQVQNIE